MAEKAQLSKSTHKRKWYQTTVAVIVLLIVFWPVGLYLMWKYTSWAKGIKITLSVIAGLFGILFIYAALNPTPILSIDNVKDGKISTDDKSYTVSGTLTGLRDGVAITINDKTALRSGDQFSLSIELKDGDNQVTVKATKDDKSDEETFIIYKTPESELTAKREAETKAKKAEEETAAAKKLEEAKTAQEKKQAEDAAAAKKKVEDEAAAKKKADEEAARNAPKTSFSDGTFLVNKDIQPGTYRNTAGYDSCYWVRLSGTSGSFDEILANGNPSGQAIVTIQATDNAFTSQRCGTWTKV
jgi:hypothetical protein